MLDADYIRDAERNGMPCPEPVFCPCCGKECETIYMIDCEPVGCERCIKTVSSDDWKERWGRE